METKHILIVEDNKNQALALKKIISSFDSGCISDIAYTYNSALNLINSVQSYDAFFLDIALSKNDTDAGIELGHDIRKLSRYKNTPIVYITSYTDKIKYAINTLHCYGFIYKPYSLDEINSLLKDLFYSRELSDSISIKIDDSLFFKISYSSLIMVNSKGKYMYFHTTDGVYTSRQYTMSQLEEIFPSDFVRCHRSYIINKRFMKSYDLINNYICMSGIKELIPISREIDLP